MLKPTWDTGFFRKINSDSHTVISKTNSASFPGLSYKRNKIFIPTIYMSLKQIPSFHQQCPVQNSVAMERHSSVLFRLNLHPRQADDGFVPSTQCSVPRAHQWATDRRSSQWCVSLKQFRLDERWFHVLCYLPMERQSLLLPILSLGWPLWWLD